LGLGMTEIPQDILAHFPNVATWYTKFNYFTIRKSGAHSRLIPGERGKRNTNNGDRLLFPSHPDKVQSLALFLLDFRQATGVPCLVAFSIKWSGEG